MTVRDVVVRLDTAAEQLTAINKAFRPPRQGIQVIGQVVRVLFRVGRAIPLRRSVAFTNGCAFCRVRPVC